MASEHHDEGKSKQLSIAALVLDKEHIVKRSRFYYAETLIEVRP